MDQIARDTVDWIVDVTLAELNNEPNHWTSSPANIRGSSVMTGLS